MAVSLLSVATIHKRWINFICEFHIFHYFPDPQKLPLRCHKNPFFTAVTPYCHGTALICIFICSIVRPVMVSAVVNEKCERSKCDNTFLVNWPSAQARPFRTFAQHICIKSDYFRSSSPLAFACVIKMVLLVVHTNWNMNYERRWTVDGNNAISSVD